MICLSDKAISDIRMSVLYRVEISFWYTYMGLIFKIEKQRFAKNNNRPR